ncbi:MAG: DUF2752 domain-containing protein [Micromonosporaceae bacterium]
MGPSIGAPSGERPQSQLSDGHSTQRSAWPEPHPAGPAGFGGTPTQPGAGSAGFGGAPTQPGKRHRLAEGFSWLWSRLIALFAMLARLRWFAPFAVLAGFAAFSAIFLINDPTDGQPELYSGCALKALTGFDCPGCGGTRAFWYLMHGNLPEAAQHHMFAVFAAPILVYLYLAWAGRRVLGRQLPSLPISSGMVAAFFIGWGAFTVLRNLPWEPFTYFYV